MKEFFGSAFRALWSRNFRLFFFGQGVSLIGTWMQRIALQWLVYRMTGSPLLLGTVAFSSHIPIFLFSPAAGVFLDRFSRQKILVTTQALAMLQASLLAFLVLTGRIEVWHIIVLGLFSGFISAFDIPGRQSFYVEMLDRREDLQNAIALNSSMFHISRFIGPAAAGFIIAGFGEGISFLINALSFIAVLASLLAMKFPKNNLVENSRRAWEEFKDGFRYTFSDLTIRNVLFLVALVSFAGAPYVVLLPIFAKDILGGGPLTLGFLTSAASIGALIGASYVASRKKFKGTELRLISFAVLFGVSLILFSFSKLLWLSLALMVLVGLGMVINNISANSFLQVLSTDDKRGRVMSLYIFSHQGMMPFGEFLLGALASLIGAPLALVLGGGVTVLSALFFGPKIISSAAGKRLVRDL